MSKNNFIIFVLFVCFNIIGCASENPRQVKQEDLIKLNPKQMIKEQEKAPVVTKPQFKEKLQPITRFPRKRTKLFSLVFHQAKLGDILNALSAESKMNISIDSNVDLNKPITVRLKDVTLDEALNMIVKRAAGYSWKIEGDFIFVKRFEEYIYHFDYLNLIGKTNIAVGGDMLASGVEEAGVTGKYEIKATTHEKGIDIWDSIKKTLNSLKSSDGIIRIDKIGGIIYMKDTPQRIESMVKFLNNLSESLSRQVIIDANVLEVTLSDTNKYGIDWNEMEIAFKSKWGGLPDNMNINFNNGYILLSGKSSLNAVLDFLRTKGDITVLSNPHLSVLNGQSALLTVGYQYPYGDIEGVDRDTETGLITYGSTIKRAVLGLQLGITPHIAKNGIITLHIVPTITRIQQNIDVDVPVAAGQIQHISNPIIDLQELSTSVMVKDGQTLVLAGLISQVRKLEKKGLPFLSKIPILGHIFRKTEQEKENRELVIFITPHIRNIK